MDTRHYFTQLTPHLPLQVSEVIYERRGEYDRVLYCYWSDTSRTDKVFSFIYQVMNGNYTDADRIKIRETCVGNIDKLIAINNEDTATLILKVFSADLDQIVEMLRGKPRVLYSLLQCVFDVSKERGEEEGVVNPSIHHLYIDLMTRYNPEFVCPYLRVAAGYNLDTILEMCLIANLKDAAAYLYEKKGELSDAFKLYYDVLRDRIDEGQLNFIEETLTKIISFCQRNSHQLTPGDKESYWFSLVDLLLSLDSGQDCVALQEGLIDNMLGFVSSSKVLDKLIKSSSSKMLRTYGDIKRVIGNMLDTLMYEEVLLTSTKQIVHNDIFTALRKDRAELLRGRNVTDITCVVCCHVISPTSEPGSFLVFCCAHTCHTACVEHQSTKYCVLCESDRVVGGREEVLTTRVYGGGGMGGVGFEGWRAVLNTSRKVRRGPDRLELLHELWGEDGDDNSSMDSTNSSGDDMVGRGGYKPSPRPGIGATRGRDTQSSGGVREVADEGMDNFMTSRPTYLPPPPPPPVTTTFTTTNSASPATRRFGRRPPSADHNSRLYSKNPFGDDDQASDTGSGGGSRQPVATSSTNPFDVVEDTNPFAIDNSLNPFGDDDEI
eukprot:sb/3463166/